jgi:hypothetical protein
MNIETRTAPRFRVVIRASFWGDEVRRSVQQRSLSGDLWGQRRGYFSRLYSTLPKKPGVSRVSVCLT